ncbi:GSCFA domain-containing protein [Chrysiogenes arsenatis]|uniref:GSCFA domain-containing protein n=1 Tax=Chrysiogenes arsenatis TaxID=309797 RepID=UPI00040D2D06|nr:GSCFA domain-containing protein [Chrysiogenes arsenatis]
MGNNAGIKNDVYSFRSMKDVLNDRKKNKYSLWHKETGNDAAFTASYRLKQEELFVSIKPEVQLKKDNVFFTVGSCFARRLEQALNRRGIAVPAFTHMLGEREAFPTLQYINKYNSYTILYEIEYALGIKENPYETIFGSDTNGYTCGQSVHLNKEDYAAVKNRRSIILECFRQFINADVLVFTLGMTEAWYDNLSERYLNTFSPAIMMNEADRYSFKTISLEENINNLHRIYGYIKAFSKKDFKIFVTVSPVPLLATFSRKDVLVANSLSKSILRVAADIFSESYENVYYFPSYELAMCSPREKMFESDLRHISEHGAGCIIDSFLKVYMPDCTNSTQL